MLKYEKNNSSGLLVEFMEDILQKYRHTKPKLSSWNVNIVWSTVYASNGLKKQAISYGFIAASGYFVVCILSSQDDIKEFEQLCVKEGIKL